MKLLKKTGWRIALFGLLLITTLIVWRDISYWGDFRAFKALIREHNFKIVGEWWYDEDFELEDYGVKVATKTSQFWIDSRYYRLIRTANEPITGIWVQHEDGVKSKAFAIDSPFWRAAELPTIRTFGDFLKHADAIIPKLRNADVPSVSYSDEEWERNQQHLVIRFNDKPGNPNQVLQD
jgi:hypothetical protein